MEVLGNKGARLVDSCMGGDPFTFVTYFHHRAGISDIHRLTDEWIGDAIISLLYRHMVIDMDLRLFP